MKIKETSILGCYEIQPAVLSDLRGSFVKIFNYDNYEALGLRFDLKEEYYSISGPRVIRGLHFQIPPKDHVKIVYCVHGHVRDVLLDLRVGSPSYGIVAQFDLSDINGNALYIPNGVAHGFCVTGPTATMVYKTSSVYAEDYDSGILYDSIKVDWPVEKPILSDRDLSFPRLESFKSPFSYYE